MIERTVTVSPSPEELAYEFSKMNSDQQAIVFNEIGSITSEWEHPFCFQLQYIADSEELTKSGREVMELIGEYGATT